jgi:lipopolysaccharide assembly outer membrane protein LptD (OstA)
VTTFTPENTPDILIDVPLSVLDMETRVLTARQRTTVRRGDMNIAGDSVTFDTNTRQGTFVGNVKMVITGNGELVKKPGE